MAPLEQLGFALAGYGCTTCIGNSGPLDEPIAKAIEDNDLVVAAVLSGNRNFEGRIHPLARASYLASPPLVVAFALAGPGRHRPDDRAARDAARDGRPVMLADIWPSPDEIRSVIGTLDRPGALPARPTRSSSRATSAGGRCRSPPATATTGTPDSTYIAKPPFFDGLTARRRRRSTDIDGARVLAVLGDSVTTDHISPAGSIAPWSPAGAVAPGARRRRRSSSTRTAPGAGTTR